MFRKRHRDLEDEIRELENNKIIKTLNDEARFNCFAQNHEKFSVAQFEKLMN